MKKSQLENKMLQFLNSDFLKFTIQERQQEQEAESSPRKENIATDVEIIGPKSKSLNRMNRIQSFEDEQPKLSSKVFQQFVQDRDKTQKRQQVKVDPKSVRLTFNLTTCNFDLPILKKVMEKNDWRKAFNFDGDILWSGKTFTYDFAMVFLNQTISRLPGMKLLANKKETTIIMQKAQEYFPNIYNFFPRSYTLPEDMPLLEQDYKKDRIYIAKPDKGTQGQGIYIVNELNELFTNGQIDMQYCKKNLVVQEYLRNPMLIDNKKFDLRLYVLVTSLNPLIVYLNEEGLARFCTEEYEDITDKNISNVYMHLTNYSLNKNSNNFESHPSDFMRINQATKRTYTSAKKSMVKMGVDVPKLKLRIEQAIVRFMYAMHPYLLTQLREVYQEKWQSAKCFHLLGFDVLVDSDLKPWILEINANPSLDITTVITLPNGVKKYENSTLDTFVKAKILEDAFLISVKPAHEQLGLVGRGKYFNSYKMIIDGVPPIENIDLFSKILDTYTLICGHKFGNLNQLKFSRLANNPQLLSDTLIKSDFDLIYKRVLIKYLTPDMNFRAFIEAIEIIAEKLLKRKTTNYTLQKAVAWVVKTATQQRPATAKPK